MQFSELTVGQKFVFNGTTYEKVEPQKVSCCKVLNAKNVSNNQKIMIKPVDNVEPVTE